MCEMVDPYTSRSIQVEYVAAIKTKNYRENHMIGCEVQKEGSYFGEDIQRTRVHIQRNDQHHSQLGVAEAPNNKKEEYLQLYVIP